MKSNLSFKNKYSFSDRCIESEKIIEKYQGYVPFICENNPKYSFIISKTKFIVPCDLTLAQFMCSIRKKINIHHEDSIFIIINNILPPMAATMNQIYKEHKDLDGFCYFNICKQQTFGAT